MDKDLILKVLKRSYYLHNGLNKVNDREIGDYFLYSAPRKHPFEKNWQVLKWVGSEGDYMLISAHYFKRTAIKKMFRHAMQSVINE